MVHAHNAHCMYIYSRLFKCGNASCDVQQLDDEVMHEDWQIAIESAAEKPR